MNKEIHEFCYKYEAYVKPSTQMHRRVRQITAKSWNYDNFNQIYEVPYEQVPCVEIHMPEDRFRALLEHDEWLYKSVQNGIRSNEAHYIIQQHDLETRLRQQHPGLKDLYDQYQTMLKLVS